MIRRPLRFQQTLWASPIATIAAITIGKGVKLIAVRKVIGGGWWFSWGCTSLILLYKSMDMLVFSSFAH
jgi:hypothetical protein